MKIKCSNVFELVAPLYALLRARYNWVYLTKNSTAIKGCKLQKEPKNFKSAIYKNGNTVFA